MTSWSGVSWPMDLGYRQTIAKKLQLLLTEISRTSAAHFRRFALKKLACRAQWLDFVGRHLI